jgi:hypothetical protein
MAIRAKKTKIVVDEMAKFERGEIEFLFELIKNSMIPGKHIHVAMNVVTKLKNQYKLLDKQELVIQSKESSQEALKKKVEKAQKETMKKVKMTSDEELWIIDED